MMAGMNDPTAHATCIHCGQAVPLDPQFSDPFKAQFPGTQQGCPNCKKYTPIDGLIPAREFRFEELGKITHGYRALSSHRFPSAAAFAANVDRVIAITMLPDWLNRTFYQLGVVSRIIQSDLRRKETVSWPADGPKSREEAEALGREQDRVNAEAKERLTSALADRRAPVPILIRSPQSFTGELDSYLVHQPSFDDLLKWRTTPAIALTIDSIMSGMVLGAWSAFETLAGDLWEDALNAYPRLATLRGKPSDRIDRLGAPERKGHSSPQKKQGDSVPDDDAGGYGISTTTIDRVTRGEFDVVTKMGTLLRTDDAYNFLRLEGIRKAYSEAFFEHSDKVDAALGDRAIDALNAVRNLIVHRAGKADEEYLEKRKRAPAAPALGLGEQLKLDGAVTAGLIQPVIERGAELVVAVDRWIEAHRRMDECKKKKK